MGWLGGWGREMGQGRSGWMSLHRRVLRFGCVILSKSAVEKGRNWSQQTQRGCVKSASRLH